MLVVGLIFLGVIVLGELTPLAASPPALGARAILADHSAVRELPRGTVTFLFTDIEGSTRLLHELGRTGYADVLAEHRRVLREAFERHGGVEVDTQGDAFFVAFPDAADAVAAAARGAGRARRRSRPRSDGPPHRVARTLTTRATSAPDVHLGARVAAAGHGGQVLLSASDARARRRGRARPRRAPAEGLRPGRSGSSSSVRRRSRR